MKSEIDWVRRAQRVIRMVSELHRLGYQHLRIMPYEHPNAWRLAIAPRDRFSGRNGACLNDDGWGDIPIYSGADGNRYFGWDDAMHDNARALAEKFLERFPVVSQRGKGRDWCYSGWLSELVAVLEQGDFLPVTLWEYMKGTPEELEFLPIWSASGQNTVNDGSAYIVAALSPSVRKFPLPPRSENDDDRIAHSSNA